VAPEDARSTADVVERSRELREESRRLQADARELRVRYADAIAYDVIRQARRDVAASWALRYALAQRRTGEPTPSVERRRPSVA
jgi:hypothetical protein